MPLTKASAGAELIQKRKVHTIEIWSRRVTL